MFKEFIKDRDVLIISIVLLFAIAFQVVSNEIEGYKEINAELLEDLKYEEVKSSAYLYAFEDQKNKNDTPLLPGPVLNITPCNGDIALYQNQDYVINYDFPTKPKKLSISFSHETVKQDSIINLMPLELNEKGSATYGEVLTLSLIHI